MKFLSQFISLLVVVFCLFASAAPVRADAGNGKASLYVKNLGDQALTIITNKALTKPQKQAKLEKIFSENVDFAWVSRFVMGRYWREATLEQKKRYQTEYKKFLLLHYTSRFTDAGGGTFKIISEKDDGDGEYTISMQLQSDDRKSEPVMVDYRVRKDEGKPTYKIFDVIVEGVGLLTTQRSEFSSVIANKGIDYLIDQLVAKSDIGAL